MPDPREENDIYESANLPDDPGPADAEVAVPDAHADQLVSSMISSLQREGGGPAARRYVPAQAEQPTRQTRQQPGQQQEMPTEMQGMLEALRDERRARQDLARELQELRKPRQQEVPFSQRVFEDPDNAIDGRVRQHIDPIAQQLETFRTDMDFRMTRQQYGEDFDEAYQAWFAQVGDRDRPDPQTYFEIMKSASPGEALMNWFDNQQIRSEKKPGETLKAFKSRIEREALERHGIQADDGPAIARPVERERAPDGRFQPRHEVRLPTATSRMGHTSRSAAYSPEDGSEEAIFNSGRAKRS